MNYNGDSENWDLQGQEYSLEDNADIEISKTLLNGVNPIVDRISYTFDDETTPIKACGDFVHDDARGKESEQYRELSSQIKRRRVLQFDPEVLEEPLCTDDLFLRSTETTESLEDVMSQWVAGFTEGTSASTNDCLELDQSSEGWIADCFNDVEVHLCSENMSNTSEYHMDLTMTDPQNHHPGHDGSNSVKPHPVHTHQNVVFKGRKSYMHMPHKLASSVVYPFAFIKPCGAHGDITLKDINERLHNQPKQKPTEDPSVSYPKSAFSGKPVVGKTKINTEGGKGSITIMRTKG